ncbi:MAG: hypothetical protein ABS81_06325 [Pseudonocardia sp. SCN 72-86]|nr:MAG: hypothetical protein ABS81_06325 [Pseudonocardia sp. SCN 72-86]
MRGCEVSVMAAVKLRATRQMLDAGGHILTEIAQTIGVGQATLTARSRRPRSHRTRRAGRRSCSS